MTQTLNESGDNDALKDDWLDEGLKSAASKRERMCMFSRERMPVSQMIRFVLDPNGNVFPDLQAKLPGRGVWLHASRDVLTSVLKSKNGFSGGFKASATADDGLVELIDRLLLERCQATLGLAKRSSAIILGYDQVRNELQKRKPGWLLEASDGAYDGRKRVVGLAVAVYDRVRIANILSSSELGMAFGREHVVHALLKTGRFSDVWTTDYRRLFEYRQMSGSIWVSGTVE